MIVAKLEERLGRRCTATELNHWAKAQMFGRYEGKEEFDPAEPGLIERLVLRIANSSTNYRTYLFDSEIIELLAQLGTSAHASDLYPRYAVNIIVGYRASEALNKVNELLPPGTSCDSRPQGSGLVITISYLTEAEVRKLAETLQPFNYIMSLEDRN